MNLTPLQQSDYALRQFGREIHKVADIMKWTANRHMKCLSVRQPWASMIARGEKTIETRTWPTEYRGDLIIVSSLRPRIDDLPAGQALCIARVVDCRPMTRADELAARCELYAGAFAWVLDNIRPVEPVAVTGKLGLYIPPDGLKIKFI